MRNIQNRPTQPNTDTSKDKALREARSVAPNFCEKCGTPYTDGDFHLVKKKDGQTVFHLKCSNCKNTYILNIVAPGPNIVASQRSSINIDLNSPDEMSKFAGKSSVSKDEILDIYEDIHKGDLEQLLK